MANKTVYPYGTEGRLPSSIGLIDDLDTGGVDNALTAQQGKVIKKMLTGEWVVDPGDSAYEHYKDGYQLKADSSVIGLDIDDVDTTAQSGRTNMKIPISGYNRMKFYEYNSQQGWGSLVIDADNKVIAAYTNTPGTWITTDVPEGAVYLVYSRSSSSTSKITLYGDSAIPNVPSVVDDAIVASGSIIGNGTSLVDFAFPISKGDYLHIDFPNGDWQTAEQASTYLKAYVNLMDTSVSPSVNRRTLRFAYVGWVVPDYGYDFYATPGMGASYDTGILRIRAAAGVEVPFVIRRLSKEKCKPYLMDAIAITSDQATMRQGSASLTFGVITDMHYRSTQISDGCSPPFAPFSPLAAIMSIKEMATRIRLDNIVCMGDSIDGRQTVADARMDASDMSEFFLRTGVPLLYAVGNHDDNRYYTQDGGDRKFTQAEIYGKYVQQVDERTTIGGAMNGCNYYRDIARHKVRCITLMSIDFNGNYNFTSETRTWLTETLSSMPEGYKAIVFVHVPPPPEQMWNQTSYTGGTQTKAILADNADKIICVLTGHTHLDNVYLTPYVSVNICCQKIYNTTSGTNNPGQSAPGGSWWPVREAGTDKELLWDIVVVNQEDGLISFLRVGAGVNRYIHYNPVEVSAGGNTTLTPAVIAVDSWAVLASEASAISIAEGVVTVDASATVGSRLMAKAVDASGNFEYWCIKVVAGN